MHLEQFFTMSQFYASNKIYENSNQISDNLQNLKEIFKTVGYQLFYNSKLRCCSAKGSDHLIVEILDYSV